MMVEQEQIEQDQNWKQNEGVKTGQHFFFGTGNGWGIGRSCHSAGGSYDWDMGIILGQVGVSGCFIFSSSFPAYPFYHQIP